MPDVETVGQMIERGRKVSWHCDVGDAMGHVGDHSGMVNLKRIAAAKGEGYTLANRRPRCRIKGCPGRVTFRDKTSMHWKDIDTITDRDPEWWAFFKQRAAEMDALGWIWDAGYWRPPQKAKRPPG